VNTGGSLEATEDDITRVRGIYAEAGLMPGPMPIGLSLLRPEAEMEDMKKRLTRALQLAGKLGCPCLQPSVGSLNPKSIWHFAKENGSPEAMDLLVKHTRELVPVAEDNNCVICPETNPWTIARSIPTMQEFVDRCDSPYVRVTFDFANHMNAERIFDPGRYIRCAVGTLGDRIGIFHVKDVDVPEDPLLVLHVNEAPMGKGLLDHEAIIRASTALEPWKTFSFEHIYSREALKPAYDHIQSIVTRIGHKWTDPKVTHTSYLKRRGR
jgi:sugar phosphate isomerase/epimerase